MATQSIDETVLQALAPARAEAIRTYLVEQTGLDQTRVTITAGTTTKEPVAKETAATGSEKWIRCRLQLAGK